MKVIIFHWGVVSFRVVCPRRRPFCERRFAANQAGNLGIFSRDHAPKVRMGRTGVGRSSATRAGAKILAVGGAAKESATLDDALGSVRIAWIITLSRTTEIATDVFACGLDVGIDSIQKPWT